MFKCGASAEIHVHLDEHGVAQRKVTDLKSAADDYALRLTHKKSGFSHKSYPAKSHWSGHNGGKAQGKPSNDDKGSSQKVASYNPDMVN